MCDKLNWDKPVQTMDKRSVRILCKDRNHPFKWPIVGLITGHDESEIIAGWNEDGECKFYEGTLSSKCHLQNVPEEHHVNIYWDGKKYFCAPTIYKTREDALKWHCPDGYITTLKVK